MTQCASSISGSRQNYIMRLEEYMTDKEKQRCSSWRELFCHLLVVNIFVCCFHPRVVECVFELRTVDTISAQLQTKRTNLICKCRSRVHQGGVRYRSSLVCRCVLWMLFYVVSMLTVPYVQSRLQMFALQISSAAT